MVVSPPDLLRRVKRSVGRRVPHRSPRSVPAFANRTDIALPASQAPLSPPLSITPAAYQPEFSPVLPDKFLDWSPAVASVADGRIVGSGGGVVDAGGRVVRDSLWDVDHFRRDFRRRLPPDRSSYAGAATSVLTLWHSNYYHWLIDALPRLGVLEAAGRGFRDLPVIVPDPLTRFQSDSLDALGIEPAQRIPFDGSSVRVEELVWASPAAPIGFCSPFIPWWMRQKFAPAPVERTRRLYVARRVRSVANEDQIWPVLERHGFELVRPEELSFTQQVAAFASAELVVGPHGAGMANVVFGQDLRVLELFQPGYLNTGPAAVCRAAGHTYAALVGEPVGRPGPAKDTDIRLDPASFARVLDELVAAV